MHEFVIGDVVRYEIVGCKQERRIATQEMADAFTVFAGLGADVELIHPNTPEGFVA